METRKIIVYKPNVNFTHHKSEAERLPPIQENKRLGGRGTSSLAKKESDIVVRDIYDYFEVKPPASPKEKSAGIKPGYIVGIIAIALAICLDLIVLGWLEPDKNIPMTAKNLSPHETELAKWQEQGYQEVGHKILAFNEVYNHTITSDVDFALVGPPTFMYKDNLQLLNETRMNPGDFTRYKETIAIALNKNFTFSVRSLANNSEVSVLYKKSNGRDPFKSLVDWVATISGAVSGLANSVVRAMLIILLIVLFAIELWIIKLALFGQADKPLRPRGSKPEPSILEKLFGPKKATAKSYS